MYNKMTTEEWRRKMEIIVKLKLDNPYDLSAEEIEKDIRLSEDQIGWNFDYKIESVVVT